MSEKPFSGLADIQARHPDAIQIITNAVNA
jgi:hypothetical protein